MHFKDNLWQMGGKGREERRETIREGEECMADMFTIRPSVYGRLFTPRVFRREDVLLVSEVENLLSLHIYGHVIFGA